MRLDREEVERLGLLLKLSPVEITSHTNSLR